MLRLQETHSAEQYGWNQMYGLLCKEVLYTHCIWCQLVVENCSDTCDRESHPVLEKVYTWSQVKVYRDFFILLLDLFQSLLICMEEGVTSLPPGVEFIPYMLL